MSEEAISMVVHSVLFPAGCKGDTTVRSTGATIAPSTSSSLVVFIHGRLDVEDSSTINIPRPSVLYSEFCKGLATTKDVLLVDFHEHYNEWGKESRDLSLGPVSSAVGEAIRKYIVSTSSPLPDSNYPPTKVTLISFSMGTAILLKILENESTFFSQSSNSMVEIENIILVEPIWRCWLPFAVSRAAESVYSTNKIDVAVSNVPALALVGTNDVDVRNDSGGGPNCVKRSLRHFLPNLSVTDIEGGNHFGICSEVPLFSEEGLSMGMSTDNLRKGIIDRVTSFCG